MSGGSLSRRVDALETSLSPAQRVLAWLDEAHAHGGLEAYVISLLVQDPCEHPIDRLARGAYDGVRTSLRGKPPEQIEAAVHKALRETVFRFELVLRINVTAHQMVDRQELLNALFSAQLARLGDDDKKGRHVPQGRRDGLAFARDQLLLRVVELEAAAEARRLAEQRYLDGHPALFPDATEAWGEQLQATQQLTAMTVRLAELDGADSAQPAGPDVVSARVATLLADLVEPAKSTALEKFGERDRAMGIATSWLRSRPTPSPAHPDPLLGRT